MSEQKPRADRPTAAFVISLIAGLWMLGTAGMMSRSYMYGHGWGGGMMHDGGHGGAGAYDWMFRRHATMHGYGGGALWSWIGVAAGIAVLIGAAALYSSPAGATGWGIAILVASLIALLAGAGGLLAGVLGIIGGILAIAWKPQAQ